MCQQLCFKMTHVYTRNDGVPNYPWCTSSWSPLVISHYLMFAECLEVEVPPQVLSSHLLNTPNDEKHTLSLYKLLLGKLNIYHWRKKEKQTNNRARVQGQCQCLSNVERNKTLCSLLSDSFDQILGGPLWWLTKTDNLGLQQWSPPCLNQRRHWSHEQL
jgi:hypothetical protein